MWDAPRFTRLGLFPRRPARHDVAGRRRVAARESGIHSRAHHRRSGIRFLPWSRTDRRYRGRDRRAEGPHDRGMTMRRILAMGIAGTAILPIAAPASRYFHQSVQNPVLHWVLDLLTLAIVTSPLWTVYAWGGQRRPL